MCLRRHEVCRDLFGHVGGRLRVRGLRQSTDHQQHDAKQPDIHHLLQGPSPTGPRGCRATLPYTATSRGRRHDELGRDAAADRLQFPALDRRAPTPVEAAGRQQAGVRRRRAHHHGRRRPERPQGLSRRPRRGVFLPARGRHAAAYDPGRPPRRSADPAGRNPVASGPRPAFPAAAYRHRGARRRATPPGGRRRMASSGTASDAMRCSTRSTST